MRNEQFNNIFDRQIERCGEVLLSKGSEYATEDRLHNFKVAGSLAGVTPAQALSGMLSKHLVSVFDMIGSGKDYSEEIWDEKITDSINYLILLKAITCEDNDHMLINYI